MGMRPGIGWLVPAAVIAAVFCVLAAAVFFDSSVTAASGSGRSAPSRSAGARAGASIVFTAFMDQALPSICYSMETAALNGFPLHVLGVGGLDGFVFDQVNNRKTKKLSAWDKLLNDADTLAAFDIYNDTVVVMCDATDVLYFEPALTVLEKFLAEEAHAPADNLILFSGETNC
ncbi:hypothetical protein FVE85_4237 [Porphyridium purpureum]|uniref:Uncharacterized protein n=1 Tax=Porphyridium purpureum TaxID=35688 RepID=A0A5J4YTU4_PORPP|nr:hypothetical protein FVE85_4237 [Porphyridium purpureum]|eukprot:POR1924..scf229_5